MKKNIWVMIKDPEEKYKMTFVLGNRDVEVPSDALISVTRLENMTVPRTIMNNLLNLSFSDRRLPPQEA